MKNLSWLSRILLLVFSLSCISGNNVSITQAKIIKEFYKKNGKYLDSNYNLFVITESGCLNCDQFYLNFISNNIINKKNTFVYSTASGTHIDISPFLSDTITNLIEDDKGELLKLLGLEYSCFISVKNEKVDTILVIHAENIYQSLSFIKEIL